MDGITLFSYSPGKGFFYRIPAAVKLIGLCLFTALIFLQSWTGLAVITVILFIAVAAGGLPPLELLRRQKFILWYALFLLLFSVPGRYGISAAYVAPLNAGADASAIPITSFLALYPARALPILLFCWRLSLTAMAAAVMFRTTSSLEIQDTLESGARVLSQVFPKINAEQTALTFALLIGFIPLVMESWQSLERAWQARGGRQGIGKTLAVLTSLIPLLMDKSLQSYRAIRARSPE
ncbi:MAG: energy-coupling factor transporter transmembrane protein EcfT [Spirochaetaceae bacterium]|jgi:energy-coupling factor transporter transmembrane protein EcfT|nr:energy-coupling factor transporter transmembrane protein EcfT [Spirochaetaceae bacterium]